MKIFSGSVMGSFHVKWFQTPAATTSDLHHGLKKGHSVFPMKSTITLWVSPYRENWNSWYRMILKWLPCAQSVHGMMWSYGSGHAQCKCDLYIVMKLSLMEWDSGLWQGEVHIDFSRSPTLMSLHSPGASNMCNMYGLTTAAELRTSCGLSI